MPFVPKIQSKNNPLGGPVKQNPLGNLPSIPKIQTNTKTNPLGLSSKPKTGPLGVGSLGSKEVKPQANITKKKNLFDDDDEDIMPSKPVAKPLAKKKNLFDDDDDDDDFLTKKPQQKAQLPEKIKAPEPISKPQAKKNLFDDDDDDFSTKPKK